MTTNPEIAAAEREVQEAYERFDCRFAEYRAACAELRKLEDQAESFPAPVDGEDEPEAIIHARRIVEDASDATMTAALRLESARARLNGAKTRAWLNEMHGPLIVLVTIVAGIMIALAVIVVGRM